MGILRSGSRAAGFTALQVVLLVGIVCAPSVVTLGAEKVLSGVPEYIWWNGCTPTAAGMMLGYWDQRSGDRYWGNIYTGYGDSGNASVWWGDGTQGTAKMVASLAHIISGQQNLTPPIIGGDWHNSASYPNHAQNPDCIADFLKAENGNTYLDNMASGITSYLAWNDPSTPRNESYQATATQNWTSYYGGSFNYSSFKAEIDANRPVMLSLFDEVGGHSVPAFGYRDNMFQVKVPGSGGLVYNMTVGGMAIRTTWEESTGFAEWYGWDYSIVTPVIEGGVEWWPFIPTLGFEWIGGMNDWQIHAGMTLDVKGWVWADANHDDAVDVGDLGILGANYGTTSGATWETADFNNDGAVDVGDLGILGAHYGYGTGGSIPEPGSLALLAVSGLAMLRKIAGR